jgi:hypothetical protein
MQNAHAFVEELNKQFLLAHPDKPHRPVFAVNVGKVYDKIVYRDAHRANEDGSAVFCFVNGMGEVFKAAGWAKPAKGVRAHLSEITPEFCAKIAAAGYATTGWLYR